MADKAKTDRIPRVSKTGMIPRHILEPDRLRESQHPTELREEFDEGAITSTMPVISEGRDKSAERDHDSATGT